MPNIQKVTMVKKSCPYCKGAKQRLTCMNCEGQGFVMHEVNSEVVALMDERKYTHSEAEFLVAHGLH